MQLWLDDGACGFGEAATIGGPSWNEESPESIKHAIDAYLAPVLIAQDGSRFGAALARMDTSCRGNAFAKSAVEMALIDAVARSLNLPAWQLLGGKRHQSLPLAWTLASGDVARDLEEAQLRLQQKRHRIFKMKIGARAGAGRGPCERDRPWPGGPGDADGGRQPGLGHQHGAALSAAADRRRRHADRAAGGQMERAGAFQPIVSSGDRAAIMADETVCTPQDAMALAREQAAQVFSLKVAKHGGLLRTREVAAVAEAADIGWYGGTMLETSIGSAASAHVFATLGPQHHGCELFGPQLLVDDIVSTRMEIRDFELQLPDGPGFGVEVDLKQLERFDRARTGLTPTHIDLGQQAGKSAQSTRR